MGVTTRYLGHVDISPPLNQAEHDYLMAFSRSRRSFRDGGRYAVWPPDPSDDVNDDGRENELALGQPSLYCQWVPCAQGCCLRWSGQEKFYAGAAWLRYLIAHFLRPGAYARASEDVQLKRFTFDHDTNGVVVGEQGDNRELFSLRVRHGRVTRKTLRAGDPMPWGAGSVEPEELAWLASEAGLAELY